MDWIGFGGGLRPQGNGLAPSCLQPGILNPVRDPGRLTGQPPFTRRTRAAGHGSPALTAAAAPPPGAAGAGAEPLASPRDSDAVRAVCRAWRDPVDGPCVWLLQLARDCSAEGRALYAWARRCPAGHDELPPCALARFSLLQPHLQAPRRAWVPGAGPSGCWAGCVVRGRGHPRGRSLMLRRRDLKLRSPRRGGVGGQD